MTYGICLAIWLASFCTGGEGIAMFRKLLIANRGEVAVRIIRTCRDMGIKTVAVYSEGDRTALHVKLADEAYPIGTSEATESYLNINAIIETAKHCKAEAIHPGYGFLSEKPEFAEECELGGIVFVGPPCHCMHKAKPKTKARQLMRLLNIPVTPGCDELINGGSEGALDKARHIARDLGYPVIVKPAGGGGGIGINIAHGEADLSKAIRKAETRGKKAFATTSFYIEKYLAGVKHVEFQILADKHGNIIHLGERDCSVQRRFQKLIEESPSPVMTPFMRMKMGAAAIDVALALEYVGALTVEFFYLPEKRTFYFNEINTRLQVEHGITEMVTGTDIVCEQIRIAAGEELRFNQNDIVFRQHALECRINAEDVTCSFLPSPGLIEHLRFPLGPGIRIDEGIYEGYNLPSHYDSLIAKLITTGNSRGEAIQRMKRALRETAIQGVKTTIPFHKTVLESEAFLSGRYTTALAESDEIQGKLANMAMPGQLCAQKCP